MKKVFGLLLLITSINFAQLDLPRVSPKATLTQNVGYTTITIEYHRPSVKGRNIWSDIVPLGKVWRTGANDATTIQFSSDVVIEGNKVPAGKYSIFTIPNKDEWTVIINKVDKQWGSNNYDEKQDLLRFNVKAHSSSFTETMLFTLSDVTLSSANVNFYWEKVHIAFKVETEVMSVAYQKMKEAMSKAKPDQWSLFNSSANFAAENNVYLDEALSWTDKALEMGGTFTVYLVKAKINFKKGNYAEALKMIDKTREVGKNEKNFANYSGDIDALEKQIKAKMK